MHEMMLELLLLAALALPHPPFVRVWTQTFAKNAEVIEVRGNLVYCGSDSGVWALELETAHVRLVSMRRAKLSSRLKRLSPS